MQKYSRKNFLRQGSLLVGGAIALSSFSSKKYRPKLAFSTLGCPDWDMERITSFAKQHGYSGIEVRGIKRQMDLVKSPVFESAESRKRTMELMKRNGLQFVGLGSSSTLHFKASAERSKQLDEGKRFIDLAQQINCPYVRVFPNNFPKDQSTEETFDLITKGLLELGEHAKGSSVTVLMETHGDLVKSEDLLRLMKSAEHKHVGLVWDPTNMWTITNEDPDEMYRNIKPYIRHIHVKDCTKGTEKMNYTFLTKGEVPIMKAVDLLAKDNYKGFFSFEWEKLWHPELPEPELALADFPKVMNQHFR